MKTHIKIILLTLAIAITSIICCIIFLPSAELENYQLVIIIIVLVYITCYPSVFYTIFRIISEKDNIESKVFESFLMSSVTTESPLIGLIIVPILLAPVLIIEYIRLFTYDLKHKND